MPAIRLAVPRMRLRRIASRAAGVQRWAIGSPARLITASRPSRAPAGALEGRDAVINLAGEPIAQRWTPAAREAIRLSRIRGTANLIAGIGALASGRPRVLASASAVGYYGDCGDRLLAEDSPPGKDFLAGVCAEWEAAAAQASQLGLRVAVLRTGVVLDRSGGALAKMLPPFRLGAGGPVAGGRQYISWIAPSDLSGLYLLS